MYEYIFNEFRILKAKRMPLKDGIKQITENGGKKQLILIMVVCILFPAALWLSYFGINNRVFTYIGFVVLIGALICASIALSKNMANACVTYSSIKESRLKLKTFLADMGIDSQEKLKNAKDHYARMLSESDGKLRNNLVQAVITTTVVISLTFFLGLHEFSLAEIQRRIALFICLLFVLGLVCVLIYLTVIIPLKMRLSFRDDLRFLVNSISEIIDFGI